MRSAFLLAILVPSLALGACATSVDESADTNSDVTSPAASDESPAGDPAAAGVAARQHLATRLGVDANDIAAEETEPRDWSDSCLGLGGPAESCLAAITPGFSMVLVHDGTEYQYRTNLDGTVVRAE